MRNIGKLVALDWKRIVKSPFAFLLIAALVIIPSLYCWFNVWALWDPYSNTQDLTVAVYSADQPATFRDQKIAVGDELMDQLKHNKQLGWRFVDSKKAVQEGVKSGKYYAGVVVPKHFSTDLLSFVDGKIHKPKLDYYVNEKINAIAPKITSTGASTLQNTISDEFVATVAKTLVKTFNKAGIKLDQNMPMIRRFASLVTNTNDQLPTIEKYLAEVDDLQGKMPAIQAKLQTANEIAGYLPEVNQMAQKLTAANGYLPMVQDAGELATAVKGKLPEVQQADAGLTLIAAANTSLSADLTTLQNQLQQLDNSQDTAAVKQAMVERLTALAKRQGKVADNATSLAEMLERVQASLNKLTGKDDQVLAGAIAQLKEVAATATAVKDGAEALAKDVPNLSTSEIQARLGALAKTADQFAAAANALKALDIGTSVKQVLNDFKAALEDASTTLATINNQILPELPSLLNGTKDLLTQAHSFLVKAQQQLPALKQELTDANTLLNGHMNLITSGVTTVADLYQNDFPSLKAKLTKATDFINQDLPGIEKDLTNTLALANEKMPQLQSGLDDAHTFIKNDWPTLKDAIQKGAAAIKKGEKSVDLSQLIKLLRRDATKEAGFLAKPVELKQQSFYAIPTYGSQSAPFYLALCIWVGALLLGAILITEYRLPPALSDATVKQMYVARWLTFVGLGMLQGLIAALGNLFLIGTYVVDKPLYLLFSMMLSVVFVSILYMLISLFGNIGKGIGIIILVLSISGAGGNFPVVLSGKFFQMINPWLPFTYAVNLLRETVGGIYWPNLWLDLAVLAAFGISFFLLGLFLKGPIHPWIEKMHTITRRSKIIE